MCCEKTATHFAAFVALLGDGSWLTPSTGSRVSRWDRSLTKVLGLEFTNLKSKFAIADPSGGLRGRYSGQASMAFIIDIVV